MEQFKLYKLDKNDDITNIFFKNYKEISCDFSFNRNITYTDDKDEHQFSNYKHLNFHLLQPFLTKYFNPSDEIMSKVEFLKNKYKIDLDNTCGVFYRGNDKITETIPPKYKQFIKKVRLFKKANPGIKFYLQTDEQELHNIFLEKFPKTISITEVPRINNSQTTVALQLKNDKNKMEVGKFFVASVYLISRMKNTICTSGNGEMWSSLFRGNANGVIQFLRPKKIIYGVPNSSYNPNQTNFWID